MPAKSQWLLRVPEICAELAQLDVPVVDRAVIEGWVDLKHRRTIGALPHSEEDLPDRPEETE